MSGNTQHESADRIGGSLTIVDESFPRFVSMRRDILTKRAQQILKERQRQSAAADRLTERKKNLIPIIELSAGLSHCLFVTTSMQPCEPIVDQVVTFRIGPGAFVGEIVGDARERVHRGHVGPHGRRQQQRSHRKIFVVSRYDAAATCVRLFQSERITGRVVGGHFIADGT